MTLSDARDTGPPQGVGQSKQSGVWNIVKRLNDERIKVDHELRDEEQAEIRSLLNKQVKPFLLNSVPKKLKLFILTRNNMSCFFIDIIT